jgi:hypothetical protein
MRALEECSEDEVTQGRRILVENSADLVHIGISIVILRS